MTKKPDPEDQKERDKNMDRYDRVMNESGHYSQKGWKKYLANLGGKCIDGAESKAARFKT